MTARLITKCVLVAAIAAVAIAFMPAESMAKGKKQQAPAAGLCSGWCGPNWCQYNWRTRSGFIIPTILFGAKSLSPKSC